MSDVNPFDNQPSYGQMVTGGHKLPGIVTEITGCDRKFNFDKQKSVDKSGATSVFKGEDICDSIKVKCALTTAAHFVELAAYREAVLPKKGKKPDALDVQNAILLDQGIKSVALKVFGQPTYEGGGLWTVSFEFVEYSPPKPTQTGSADKSKGFTEPTPTAQSAADKEVQALLNKAKEA